MHKQLLSERERKMLKQFLETKETTETFRMLKRRIKQNYPRLTEDYELIKKAIEKF